MDRLDFALFRELTREPVLVWGGVGCRISPPALARRLRVDPTTVRARLKRWSDTGFLARLDTVPNPRVLGLGLRVSGVRARSVGERGALLDAMAAVPGIVHAVEYAGPWIGFSFVGEREAENVARVVANLKGAERVQTPFHREVPPSAWAPSATGWRVLSALSLRSPDSVRAAAKAARVSMNTFHRQAEELTAKHALLSVPSFDFRRYEGAVLARVLLELEGSEDAAGIAHAVRARLGDDAVLDQPWILRIEGAETLSFTLHAPSVPAIEDVELALASVPGVSTVEILYPRRTVVFRDWFEARLGSLERPLPHASETRPARAPARV